MKRVIPFWLFLINVGFSQNYSYRIAGLGSDFIGIIKDKESEIYRNPVNLKGFKAMEFRTDEWGYYPNYTPIGFGLFHSPIGIYCRYTNKLIGVENSETINEYEMDHILNTFSFFSINRFGFGYEFYIHREERELISHYGFGEDWKEEIIFNALNLGTYLNNWQFNLRFVYSLYDSSTTYHWDDHTQVMSSRKARIPSTQIGIMYLRDISDEWRWGFLLDIGGPGTSLEMENLPIPLRQLSNNREYLWFANSLITRITLGLSFRIEKELLLGIALTDYLLKTENKEVSTAYLSNQLRCPIGIEFYPSPKLSIRGSVVLIYQLGIESSQTTNNWKTSFLKEEAFGLGGKFGKGICIDVYTKSGLSSLRNWRVSIKKEW